MALLKFLKGNYSSLNNATINEGQILVCGDTGELFVDVAADKRVKIGDFITVANIAALEALDATAVPTSRLYYVEDGNILARSNGTSWVQVNKQKTADELKTMLGLGSLAYLSEVSETNLSTELKEKVNAAAEGNHAHSNKEVLDGITAEKVAVWDAAEQNAKDYADGLADNYAAAEHTHTKDEITDFAHTHVAKDITDLDDTIKAYDYATKTELGDVDKKFENYKTAEAQKAIDDEQDRRLGVIEGDYLKAADIANFETKENVKKVADDLAAYVDSNDKALAGVKATAEAAAVKTEVEAALALKADKSVVDAMYTNTKIDELVQGAKDYADENDTKYGIVYDSENKKIKLVEGGTEVEIDATDFIKDGMIETVTIGDDNDLVITFNTAAGKENIVLPLDQLVDIYTGVEGARVKVTVASDKSISADLVAGSIGKNYLDDGVQASLALADSALQAHQDISHLATTEALNNLANGQVKTNKEAIEAINNTETGILKQAKDYADGLAGNYAEAEHEHVVADITDFETVVETRITAKGYATTGYADGKAADAQAAAEAKAAELDAALKLELQGEIDADVKVVADALAGYKTSNDAEVAKKANSADVYAKTETYNKTEIEALLTWGEF